LYRKVARKLKKLQNRIMTKKKWLGSLLNFFVPGLGTVYGRKIKKAILIYILFFAVVLSLRFITYNFSLFLVSMTLIVGYYLYLIVVGYRDVESGKVYEPARFDKWYVYILIPIVHVVLVNSINRRTLDRLTPINFANVPTPAMDPALQIGDILAFEKTKSIKRNDVTIFWFPIT
jgi:signal peptidase I